MVLTRRRQCRDALADVDHQQVTGDGVENDAADEEQARTEQVHHHIANARNQRASALTHHDQSRRRQRVDLNKDEGGEHIVGINQRNQGEHHQIRQDTINIVLGRLDLLLGFAHTAEESEQNDQQEHRQRNRFQYADANLIAPRRGEVTHLVGIAVARLQGVDHHADIHRQIRKDEEQRRPARHPAAHHGAGDRAHQRQQNTEEGEVLNELHVIPPPFPQGQ